MSENEVVLAQHAMIGNVRLQEKADYRRTQHPDAQWYAGAGLGLFFHWGISSVCGKCDLSWGMMKRPAGYQKAHAEKYGIYAAQTIMTPTDYWRQAEQFLCEKYDPNKWLSAAREAGVKYVVLTTKHHDGFCLWPSKFGDLNTKKYLGGRDLVGEFVEACRQNGMKIGFYYSPPDWHFHRDHMSFSYGDPNPASDTNHQLCQLPNLDAEEQAEFDAAFAAHVRGQVEELLSRYGKIDVLWFDGAMPKQSMSIDDIRALQPGILINQRGYGHGDFDTPECSFPSSRLDPGWWEYCHVFSDGAWGYLDHETYKPLGWFLDEYAKTRAWDGNFLPNVAPDSHGEMPEAYYGRMRQLKEWMTHNAEAVVGTQGGPWPESAKIPLTKKGDNIYAHVPWLFDGESFEIENGPSPRTVQLLRTGKDVPFQFADGTLTVEIPREWRTNQTDVVVIR